LLNDTDSVTLLAAALKLLTKEPDTTPVNITEEKPLRVRRRRESGRSDRRRRDGNRRRDDRPRRSRDDRRSDRRNDRKGDRRRDDRKSDRPRGEKKTRHQSEGFKPYFKD
ncbi:MAG: DEAD/DEAH box helicase, partial [Veillonella sp.]|nr:DEAD/DEAH box helicase [Veillonella sp.]